MYKKFLVSIVLLCYCIIVKGQAPTTENAPKIDHHQNLKNYGNLLQRAEQQLKAIMASKENKVGNSARRSMSNDLNLAIINERVLRIGSQNWFEFDITASANTSGTFLDICFIKVGYNTAVFGNSVTTNGNIVVTPASPLNVPTYNPLSTFVNDNTASEINLPVATSTVFTPLNRWQVTTSPTIIMTVRMRIQTCGQPVNISFTSQSITTLFSWFAPSASVAYNDPSVVGYDNVNYSGNITDAACVPIITAWTNGVPAGENRNVTVTGKYFGQAMTNGASVIFKNANHGFRYPILSNAHGGGIQPMDLVSWDHNQIVIKLPSIIDSVDYYKHGQVLPVLNGQIHVGSGKFKVRNNLNGIAESSAPIDIPWNVTQYMDDYPIIPVRYRKVHAELAGKNNRGYRVLINNRINTAWSDAKPVIIKAMRDWSCATGINWYYGGDTTKKYSALDNFCIIDTADFSPLMETPSSLGVCTDPGGPFFYLNSFDIKIRRSVAPAIWNRDTANGIPNGDYDFYSVISHEFGHAHQLSHINDSIKDLMWYIGYKTGYLTFNDRKTVKGSPEAVSGGNFVTDSLLFNYSCVPTMTLVYPSNCEGFDVSVKKYGSVMFNISAFPNPSRSNENVKIQSDLKAEKPVEICLRDITGKQIFYEQLAKRNRIDYNLQTKEIDPGLYLLQIRVGTEMQTIKLLKE